ncbi:DNA primase [Streptomyces ziwulingensis]|uniref:DNA primase n=1 Tax=Streptomyces ziwulingensis TaxID=1045501 RepID=A0ABP9AWY8_9ACTN
MNRVGLGLAVGAGYLLGRTKKLKFAVAVGTMVAGKKLNLTPQGIAKMVSGQLQNNPQFKEIGDQLRQDMSGVGKAATGALVERQINAFADRLHGRTAQVQDQLSGVVSKVPGAGRGRKDDEEYDDHDDEEYDERDARDDREDEEPERRPRPRGRRPAEADDSEDSGEREPARKAPVRKAAVKKTAERKAPVKKTAAKRTQSARKTAQGAARGLPKGGGER